MSASTASSLKDNTEILWKKFIILRAELECAWSKATASKNLSSWLQKLQLEEKFEELRFVKIERFKKKAPRVSGGSFVEVIWWSEKYKLVFVEFGRHHRLLGGVPGADWAIFNTANGKLVRIDFKEGTRNGQNTKTPGDYVGTALKGLGYAFGVYAHKLKQGSMDFEFRFRPSENFKDLMYIVGIVNGEECVLWYVLPAPILHQAAKSELYKLKTGCTKDGRLAFPGYEINLANLVAENPNETTTKDSTEDLFHYLRDFLV